jgi:hypothetical protein
MARLGASSINGGMIPLYSLDTLGVLAHVRFEAMESSPLRPNDVLEGLQHRCSALTRLELLSSLDHIQGVEELDCQRWCD